MKILFLDSPAFAKRDMIDAFEKCGIKCRLFFHDAYNERSNPAYLQAFNDAISKDTYEFVFSFNYFPILSNCCKYHNIKYISYVYDSPLVSLYSCTLINSCNYIFLFDKTTYSFFKSMGIETVYYLPLAANVKRLRSIKSPAQLSKKLHSDVSFVGSLYNEKHNLFDRLTNLSDYAKGYLDAIMSAQQKIYGSFILEELLNPNILNMLQASAPYTHMPDGIESPAYVYANYFLARKITSNERISLLNKISAKFQLKLYSHKSSSLLPDVEFIGPVDYYHDMPLVFLNSKINLNISLKSIYSGIPLRCMDIMGAGTFLLTNYQEDFFDFFQANEDFVFYESEEDCVKKIEYYLFHESERRQIAANAAGKMAESHTFLHRAKTILSIIH